MRRQGMALISAVTISLAGLIGGLASPAFAAGQPTNPYTGLGPMVAWVWNGSNSDPVIMFDFNGQAEGFPINRVIASSVSRNWTGIDNPAPLNWYYNNVSKTDLGNSVFGAGVPYSTTLISKMQAENFAPSMVGGVNPSGMTSGTTSTPPSTSSGTTTTTPKTSPSPTPTHSTAPVASTTPTVSHSTAPATTTDVTKTTTAPVTHSTAPASSSATTTTPPTKAVTTPASSQTSHTQAPASSKTAPTTKASTLLQPPGVKKETPPKAYHQIIRRDQKTLEADGHSHHPAIPTPPWVPITAGVVALGLVGSGGWWAWRRFGR